MYKGTVGINPLDENVAIFNLSSGERIDVELSHDGSRVRVTSWKGGILVRPRDGNSVEISPVLDQGGG
jgi:hypothetical protein